MSNEVVAQDGHNTPANLGPAVDDLHRIFPEIPPNERAIRNFPCSHLVRKFMCVGRLYITPTRLAFVGLLSSNVTFEWADVTQMDKKSSLLFDSIEMKVRNATVSAGGMDKQLPNSPSMGMPSLTDVCFTGFVNGSDEPFQIMKTLWNVKRSFGGGQPHPSQIAQQQQQQQSQVHSRTASASGGAAHQPQQGGGATLGAESSEVLAEMLVEGRAADERGGGGGADSETGSSTPRSQKSGGGGGPVHSLDSLPGNDGPSTSELGVDMMPMSPATRQRAMSHPPPAVASSSSSSSAAAAAARTPPSTPHAIPASTPASPSSSLSTSAANNQQQQQQQQILLSHDQHGQTHSGAGESAGVDGSGFAVPPLPGGLATPSSLPSDTAALDHINPHDLSTKFPGVPKTERILDTFQCSWVAGVHRYGRMAVTRNYILFSSLVSVPVIIKLADVETLTKKTSLVILDGFSVNTRDGTTNEFTSFAGTRDKCYNLICDLVRLQAQVNVALGIGDKPSQATLELGRGGDTPPPRPANPADVSGKKRRRTKQENGDNSNKDGAEGEEEEEHDDDAEEDGDENDKDDGKESTAPPSPHASSADVTASPASPGDGRDAPGSPAAAAALSNNKLRFATSIATANPATWINVGESLEKFDTLLPHGWGEQAFSPPSKLMETVLLDNIELPAECSLSDIFRVLFDDNVQFAIEYRVNRPPVPDRDTKIEPWKKSAQSGVTGGTRRMDCTATIRALTVVVCPYHEFQRFLLCTWKGKPTLVVQFSGQAVGAMFSDTFRAETMMVFQPRGGDNNSNKSQIVCTVYFHILYISAPFMIKGKIKSSAFSECQDSYRMFFKIANKYMKEDVASPVGIAPRSGSAGGPAAAAAAGGKKAGGKKGNKKDAAASAAGGGDGSLSSEPSSPASPSGSLPLSPAAAAYMPASRAAAAGAAPAAASRQMHMDYARKAFLVLAAVYALRAQFSLWWSAPQDPATMPNYVAWNHLLVALSCTLLAYVAGELSLALSGMF